MADAFMVELRCSPRHCSPSGVWVTLFFFFSSLINTHWKHERLRSIRVFTSLNRGGAYFHHLTFAIDLPKIKGQITKQPTMLPNLVLLLPILHTIVGVRHKTWGKEQNQLFQGCPVLPSSIRTCYIAALHSHMRCWWMRPCGSLTAPILHQTRHCERPWFQRFDRRGAGARDWTNNHLSSASPEPRLPRRQRAGKGVLGSGSGEQHDQGHSSEVEEPEVTRSVTCDLLLHLYSDCLSLGHHGNIFSAVTLKTVFYHFLEHCGNTWARRAAKSPAGKK